MRVLVNNKSNEKQPIHSGHFMVSNFEDETQEEDEVLVPDDPEEALRTESVITFVPQIKRARVDFSGGDLISGPALKQEVSTVENFQTNYEMPERNLPGRSNECPDLSELQEWKRPLPLVKKRYNSSGDGNSSTLEIDQSLTKLFQCMSIAYRQKLTSPKWNLFKGMKLRWKDKIRLNNVIWRCWHMQFIFKHRGTIIQFASPLDTDQHCKPEAIVLEGKYWKRRMATVTAEYKKWRIFFKNKILGRNLSGSDQNLSQELDLASSGPNVSSRNISMGSLDMFDDEFLMEFSDTLFTSLASNQPYPFPNAREIARNVSIADFIQPGLIQLQPYLDEFQDIEALHNYDMMNGRLHMSADDVTSVSEFTPLAAPLPPTRSLPPQPPTPAAQLRVMDRSSLSDSFSSEFTSAENRMVDPLKTIMVGSTGYSAIRQGQEYQYHLMDGRPRANSLGKRSYQEFTRSTSGGTVTVNSQQAVSGGGERSGMQVDLNREFAIPLARQRSRSRSGSTRPPILQSVSPSPPPNRPDIEPMQTEGQLIIPDLIPFNGRIHQQYQRRDSVPVLVDPRTSPHSRVQGDMRVRLEPRVPLPHSTEIVNRQFSQTRENNGPANVYSPSAQDQQYRSAQTTGLERKDTVMSLLQMGTGLIRVSPPLNPPVAAAQQSAFPQFDRPGSSSSLPRPNQPAIMVAQNGIVSVFSDFSTITLSQPVDTEMVHYVPVTQPCTTNPNTPSRRGRPPEDIKFKDTESRKSNHISSEQKRRGNMKNGFDVLHSLIPGLGNQPPNSKNSETSKAAMLHKGAEYIKQLRMERENQLKEIELLKKEQGELTSAISHCQSVLPATGAPVSRTNSVVRVKGAFDAWVRGRTRQNWKFWIFSRLIEPLLETFFNAIDASSPSEFWGSAFSWVEQYCSLVNLRPAALNTLREISTKTEILSDPGSLPAYAYYAVEPKSETS